MFENAEPGSGLRTIFGTNDTQAPFQIFFSKKISEREKHFYFCAEQSFCLIRQVCPMNTRFARLGAKMFRIFSPITIL
jgi:hypothetical protein